MENVPPKLKLLRELHNLNQEGVAKELCICRSSYTKLENGNIEIPLPIMQKLASLYKTDITTIIECPLKDIPALYSRIKKRQLMD